MLKGRCFNTEGTFSRNAQESAWFTLHEVLNILLKALSPITPYITDKIYRELYDKKGIHRELYPSVQSEWKSNLIEHTDMLLKTNGGFWKFKRENGLSLRQGLPEAWISKDLEPWSKDLQAMHGIGKLNFGEPEEEGLVKVTLPESEEVIFIRAPSS
jgi:valyl-tRNA synthetase